MSDQRPVIQFVSPSNCPECGKTCDALSGPAAATPNDFTICGGCGTVLAFDDQLHMRRMCPAEEVIFAANPEYQEHLRRVRAVLDQVWKQQRAQRN